jgi:hypothetical protein
VVVPIEALRPLARVMDALRGAAFDTLGETELASLDVRRVLGAIEGVGGFIDHGQAPHQFARCPPHELELALKLTHMGHASLIIDGGDRRVLIDPWTFAWDDRFEAQPLVSRQLGRVDAIFLRITTMTISMSTLSSHCPMTFLSSFHVKSARRWSPGQPPSSR